MPDLSPDTIVTAEIAGREVPGMVVGEADVEAVYGTGPTEFYPVKIPGAGTFRVRKSNIEEPA